MSLSKSANRLIIYRRLGYCIHSVPAPKICRTGKKMRWDLMIELRRNASHEQRRPIITFDEFPTKKDKKQGPFRRR